jgi:hypothetical protein
MLMIPYWFSCDMIREIVVGSAISCVIGIDDW